MSSALLLAICITVLTSAWEATGATLTITNKDARVKGISSVTAKGALKYQGNGDLIFGAEFKDVGVILRKGTDPSIATNAATLAAALRFYDNLTYQVSGTIAHDGAYTSDGVYDEATQLKASLKF